MYSFGKIPPRSLDSFGVAGLLGEKGKVFYSSLFTTRHLGRVSDLICARLQEEGLDELRLRALLLFGAFEVFRGQVATPEEMSKHRLTEPLVLECGFEEDKIAVGVSFTVQEGRFPKLEGLVKRITEGKPESAFEFLLRDLYLNSDRTVMRAQADIQRVELVALMGIPGKMDADSLKTRAPLEVIEIGQGGAQATPKIQAYVELGDLDYPQLLRDDTMGADSPPAPATGELLVHGCTEVEDAVRVRAQQLLEKMGGKVKGEVVKLNNDLIRVSGTKIPTQDNDVFKISGSHEDLGEGARTVSGTGGDSLNTSSMRVKSLASGQPIPAEEDRVVQSGVERPSTPSPKKSEKKSNQNDEVSDDAPENDAPEDEDDSESDDDDEEGDSTGRFKNILDKVKGAWPFNRGEAEDEEEELKKRKKKSKGGNEEKADSVDSGADDGADKDSAGQTGADEGPAEVGSAQEIANQLTKEIQSGFEDTLANAQKEILDLKNELKSPRAKRFVEGLMSDLVAEKSKIHDASKKLNNSIRQKEHEFRNKEQILNEELRRREDVIRQKDHALARLKEQLSQSSMSAERLKSAKAGAADDAHYKAKYGLVQKMLNSSKEENSNLVEKIDDLKNQLMNAQLSSSKRSGPSVADFSAIQTKYERALRQGEEFKKANQQLLDKLAEAKKERNNGPQEETKKRLEAAIKMAALNQKESEKLTLKLEETQREQLRLQAELNKATNDLKALKNGKVPANKPASATAAPGATPAKTPAAPKTKPPKAA